MAVRQARYGDVHVKTARVADILHVSPKTISRWARAGKLPFIKTLGGHRRYPLADIEHLARTLVVRPATEQEDPDDA